MKRFLIYMVAFWTLNMAHWAIAQPYMPVEDIQRGMVGVGRTVFQGTKIDTFKAEILGVLRNTFGPKSDMILARLSGGPLAETGVIAGMSGSPVYIDGKLIGAVGYAIGPTFTKEPIAGITPIGEMVALFDRPDTVARLGEGDGPRAALQNMGSVKPVAMPLMFSGFAPQVVADFHDELAGYGFLPMQGGGGADTTLAEGAFEPGASLGVQLIRGDMSVTGIGTLTHRVGNRILGFGHEMLSMGTTEMPMTAAYIHYVLSRQESSYKLGVATQTMGMIVQDRAPGIAGVVGKQARIMPVRIEIDAPGSQKVFLMDVLESRLLGPILVRMAVTSSAISSERLMGETTVDGAVTISLKGHNPIHIEDTFSGGQGLGLAVLGLTQPLAQVMQNPFEPVTVDSVVFKLAMTERVQAAEIDGVRLSKTQFEIGDTLQVLVTLSPLLGKKRHIPVSLKIPSYATKGRVMLRVMSERLWQSQDSKRAPALYKAENLDDLVQLIASPGRNDVMAVELLTSQEGVTISGREVGRLPESVMVALSQVRESGVVEQVRQSVLGRASVKTDYVLVGNQTVLFNIGDEDDGQGLIFSGKGTAGEQKR